MEKISATTNVGDADLLYKALDRACEELSRSCFVWEIDGHRTKEEWKELMLSGKC